MDVAERRSASLTYIPGLDGLRAISVLWVIAFHYAQYLSNELASLSAPWKFIRGTMALGWVGVDIFMVISGLLITKIILKTSSQTTGYGNFLRRRGWRLLPAYLLLLVIFTAVTIMVAPSSRVLRNSWSLWTLTSNVLLSFGDRTSLMDDHFAMYHLWSVAIEWHFYAFMPIAIRACGAPRRAAILLIASAIACRTVFHFLEISDNAIYSFSACRIDAFSMGALIAIAKPMNSTIRLRFVGAAGLACSSLLLSIIATSPETFKAITWVQTIGYTLIDVSFAMIIYFVVTARSSALPIRLLELRPVRSIGRASYSLYLWHVPFFPMLCLFIRTRIQDSNAVVWASIVAGLAFTAAFGMLSYWLVEQQFMGREAGLRPSASTASS